MWMIHSAVISARAKGMKPSDRSVRNSTTPLARSGRAASSIKWMYKERTTVEQRVHEASSIREKFPDCIPVIVQKSSKSHLKDLDKYKWVVPYDLTVAQFMYILRDKLKLTQKESIYIFIDRTLPQSSATIGELWTRHRDEDGFLYFMFSEENTFGW